MPAVHSVFETSVLSSPLPQSTSGAPAIDTLDEAELAALDAAEVRTGEPEQVSLVLTDSTRNDPEAMQALILSKLDEDKAEDVVVIDLTDKSPMADAIVVASGRSARHVSALADHVLRTLKENGFGRAAVEGLPSADWVLIDAGDVIVHLFRPEVRAFYQIEKIWSVDSPHRTPAASSY